MSPPILIKKYGNRRLYDTAESRYITLEELGDKIRAGLTARVVDAKTGEDLTQVTLTQIVLESRRGAHLLPVDVLTQLVRMGDDALAEFFGRYVAWSLEVYLQMRQGAQGLMAFNPLLRMVPWGSGQSPPPPPPPPVPPREPLPDAHDAEIDALRRELIDLKRTVEARDGARRSARKRKRPTRR